MNLTPETMGQLLVFAFTILFGIIGYLARSVWTEKKLKAKAQETAIDKVGNALVGLKDELVKVIFNLETKLSELEKQNIRQYAKLESKVDVLATSVQHHQVGVSELKGRVDDQLNLVSSHIHTLGHMSKQLERLFEFVDASKRATDLAKSKTG